MAYIEPTVFITALSADSPQRTACIDVLDSIARGKLEATTSSLSWDEVTHVIDYTDGFEPSIAAGKALLQIPRLRMIPADNGIVALAQELRAKYHLGPRDAIHAATAIRQGEAEILAYDRDYDRVKELKRKEPK